MAETFRRIVGNRNQDAATLIQTEGCRMPRQWDRAREQLEKAKSSIRVTDEADQ
jgi:hypothetical protein